MADSYITSREFDGFADTIRSEIGQIKSDMQERLTAVSAKIDTLILRQVEEARDMGELHGTIRAINDRLARMEDETRANQQKISDLQKVEELQKNNAESLNDLWALHERESSGKLKWWQQLVLTLVAAAAGAWFYKRVQ